MATVSVPNIPGVPGNPLYLIVGFLLFYYLVAKPMFDYSLLKSLLIFAVLYFLYMKFGKDKFKVSSFGRRR
jgi:hypothetical protein